MARNATARAAAPPAPATVKPSINTRLDPACAHMPAEWHAVADVLCVAMDAAEAVMMAHDGCESDDIADAAFMAFDLAGKEYRMHVRGFWQTSPTWPGAPGGVDYSKGYQCPSKGGR